MRFLIDECIGPAVAKWLREQGYEVFSVHDEVRGLDSDNQGLWGEDLSGKATSSGGHSSTA